MSHKNYFYIDIETTSKEASLFDLRMNDEKGYELFMRKIEKMKSFDSEWNRDPQLIYTDKAPLLPEYGKIICMSFGMFTDDGEQKIMTIIENTEEETVRKSAKVIAKAGGSRRFICGFGIKNFDIPFLIKKMYKYEIDIPLNLSFASVKPWEITVSDVAETWKGIGKSLATLEEVAHDLKIPYKHIINGDEVHSYYWDKRDTKTIMHKCENDILITINVAEKLRM